MGVMMGKIVEVNGKEVQLVLQGLDEEDLIKQVDVTNEMERKAKAFDEIREFITRKLKEEEEKRPRTLLSDYDEGLYKACDSVDDIIQEYVERADDE